jgi:hypothetical protein
MSGGHFDYNQHRIRDIADSVEDIIRKNGKKKDYKVSSWENEYYYEYPPEVIEKFKEGLDILRKAEIYAQRIDWLVSGDDGDETFLERLKEDLENLK